MENVRPPWGMSLLVMGQEGSQDFEFFRILSSLFLQIMVKMETKKRMGLVKNKQILAMFNAVVTFV